MASPGQHSGMGADRRCRPAWPGIHGGAVCPLRARDERGLAARWPMGVALGSGGLADPVRRGHGAGTGVSGWSAAKQTLAPARGSSPASFVAAILAGMLHPDRFPAVYGTADSPLPHVQAAVWLLLPSLIGILAGLFAAAWAVRVRLRGARGVQRMQLLWFAYAATLLPLALLICLADGYFTGGTGPQPGRDRGCGHGVVSLDRCCSVSLPTVRRRACPQPDADLWLADADRSGHLDDAGGVAEPRPSQHRSSPAASPRLSRRCPCSHSIAACNGSSSGSSTASDRILTLPSRPSASGWNRRPPATRS